MGKINNTIHIEKVLVLPKNEIKRWNNLLESEDVDYDKEGFCELSTVWCKTVKFTDGFEIDLKVCSNDREDRSLWSEAVLFDRDGREYSCTEVCYEIDGVWNLEWFDNKTGTMHEYTVVVKGK